MNTWEDSVDIESEFDQGLRMEVENHDENAQCPFGSDPPLCLATSILDEMLPAASNDSGVGSSCSAWSIHEDKTNFMVPGTSNSFMDEAKVSPIRRPLRDVSNDTPLKGKRFNRIPFRNNPLSTRKLSANVPKKKVEDRFLKRPSPKLPSSVVSLEKGVSKSMVNMRRFGKCTSPESIQTYSLRYLTKPQVESSAFKSIDGSILASLIKEMGNEKFLETFMLIDCRYPYEFEGGHIINSINMFQFDQVCQKFYSEENGSFHAIQNKIPIFYCEFSQARGPKMANALRRFDRKLNATNYPHLDYPEIYVLDSGYQGFFKQEECTELCTPRHYVRMQDTAFMEELKRFHYHKKGVHHQI
uniref:protein-tyrosine-phosphatase n=1 Tax=Bursaphelenchus xylophilus TaxID=6326 RepID=A0A1I7RSB7_BURXY